MDKLRANSIIAARDYYYSYIIYEEELKVAGGLGYFARMRDCFTVPRIRRANYGASTVMIAQQMCGINSELTLVIFSSVVLTILSHIFLQFDYLRASRLHRNSGPVRLSWVWCYSSSVYYSDVVPH